MYRSVVHAGISKMMRNTSTIQPEQMRRVRERRRMCVSSLLEGREVSIHIEISTFLTTLIILWYCYCKFICKLLLLCVIHSGPEEARL